MYHNYVRFIRAEEIMFILHVAILHPVYTTPRLFFTNAIDVNVSWYFTSPSIPKLIILNGPHEVSSMPLSSMLYSILTYVLVFGSGILYTKCMCRVLVIMNMQYSFCILLEGCRTLPKTLPPSLISCGSMYKLTWDQWNLRRKNKEGRPLPSPGKLHIYIKLWFDWSAGLFSS